MTVQQLADSQAVAVKTLYRLQPTKNKEEFEHYRLMADIRMLYLTYQKIEKEVNMPSFTNTRHSCSFTTIEAIAERIQKRSISGSSS